MESIISFKLEFKDIFLATKNPEIQRQILVVS